MRGTLLSTSREGSGGWLDHNRLEKGAADCSDREKTGLHRDGDLCTLEVYVIRSDATRCWRLDDVPRRQIEYSTMPGADHGLPCKLAFR